MEMADQRGRYDRQLHSELLSMIANCHGGKTTPDELNPYGAQKPKAKADCMADITILKKMFVDK